MLTVEWVFEGLLEKDRGVMGDVFAVCSEERSRRWREREKETDVIIRRRRKGGRWGWSMSLFLERKEE